MHKVKSIQTQKITITHKQDIPQEGILPESKRNVKELKGSVSVKKDIHTQHIYKEKPKRVVVVRHKESIDPKEKELLEAKTLLAEGKPKKAWDTIERFLDNTSNQQNIALMKKASNLALKILESNHPAPTRQERLSICSKLIGLHVNNIENHTQRHLLERPSAASQAPQYTEVINTLAKIAERAYIDIKSEKDKGSNRTILKEAAEILETQHSIHKIPQETQAYLKANR